jgi:hypothetical protein
MTDYIERETAVLSLLDKGQHSRRYKLGEIWGLDFEEIREAIKSIPAADVRPVVRAKWEDVHIDRPEIADLEVTSMFCPNCNRWHNEVYHYGNPIEFANYCCFCGADMREKI